MALLRYQPPKPKKPQKPNAEQRALADAWKKLNEQHAKPLERGAVSKGTATKPTKQQKRASVLSQVEERLEQTRKIPSLPMGAGGTKPVVDPLAEVKQKLKANVGQVYNKGGPQYLSDADIEEQKTGSHRRR